MKRILINATHNEEVRVALCKGNHLYDFDLENRTREQKKSNIYKGHITRVEPSLEAVFVEYGSKRQGFLPIREIASNYLSGNPREENIRKLIKEGDELIVQVEKEERGNKGAALSTYISLAGRYLVLMPNNPKGGGISRQISGKLRDDMKRMLGNLDLPKGMSVIIRTAGIGKTQEDLQHDLNHLLNIWNAIQEQNEKYPSPRLVHQEAGVVTRAVRDYLRDDISEIWIDNEDAFVEAETFVKAVMPKQLDKLRKYTEYEPMFSSFGVERQIETAYQREVRLPSGGSIVIDQTEALVSIDINSAKSTKGVDVSATAYHTNLEAADEIARQLRLRDMGGLIVIDFIDMNDSKHQKDVEKRLVDATKYDRARVQFGDISRFGLLEMSRQRLRPSLEESTGYVCPRCHGTGMIRDLRSLSLSIMRQIEQTALRERHGEVQAEVPTDIAAFLLNEKRESLVYLEQDSGTRITILPHAHLESPNFNIHFNHQGFAPSSYERVTDTHEQETSDRGYEVNWQTADNERPEQQPTRQPRNNKVAANATDTSSSTSSQANSQSQNQSNTALNNEASQNANAHRQSNNQAEHRQSNQHSSSTADNTSQQNRRPQTSKRDDRQRHANRSQSTNNSQQSNNLATNRTANQAVNPVAQKAGQNSAPAAVAWLSNLFAPTPQAQTSASISSAQAAEAIEAIVNTGAQSRGAFGQVDARFSETVPSQDNATQTGDNNADNTNENRSRNNTRSSQQRERRRNNRQESRPARKNDRNEETSDTRNDVKNDGRDSRKDNSNETSNNVSRDSGNQDYKNRQQDRTSERSDNSRPARDNRRPTNQDKRSGNDSRVSHVANDNVSSSTASSSTASSDHTSNSNKPLPKREPNSRRESRGAVARNDVKTRSDANQRGSTNTASKSLANPNEITLQVNEAKPRKKETEVVHLNLDDNTSSSQNSGNLNNAHRVTTQATSEKPTSVSTKQVAVADTKVKSATDRVDEGKKKEVNLRETVATASESVRSPTTAAETAPKATVDKGAVASSADASMATVAESTAMTPNTVASIEATDSAANVTDNVTGSDEARTDSRKTRADNGEASTNNAVSASTLSSVEKNSASVAVTVGFDSDDLFANRYVTAKKFGQAANDPRLILAAKQNMMATDNDAGPTTTADAKAIIGAAKPVASASAIKGTVGEFIHTHLANASLRLHKDGVIRCFLAALSAHRQTSGIEPVTDLTIAAVIPEPVFNFINYGYEPLAPTDWQKFHSMTAPKAEYEAPQGKTDTKPSTVGKRAANDPRGQHPAFIDEVPVTDEVIDDSTNVSNDNIGNTNDNIGSSNDNIDSANATINDSSSANNIDASGDGNNNSDATETAASHTENTVITEAAPADAVNTVKTSVEKIDKTPAEAMGELLALNVGDFVDRVLGEEGRKLLANGQTEAAFLQALRQPLDVLLSVAHVGAIQAATSSNNVADSDAASIAKKAFVEDVASVIDTPATALADVNQVDEVVTHSEDVLLPKTASSEVTAKADSHDDLHNKETDTSSKTSIESYKSMIETISEQLSKSSTGLLNLTAVPKARHRKSKDDKDS